MVVSPYATAMLSLFCAVTTAADTAETALAAALQAVVIEPDICEVGGSGYVFPLFGDDEASWPKALRGILYGIGVLWCFLGVAIVADLFMAAIEEITSKIYLKVDKATGKKRVHRFWNPTVANLSLMALGSSAPEILLSCVELFTWHPMLTRTPWGLRTATRTGLLCAVCRRHRAARPRWGHYCTYAVRAPASVAPYVPCPGTPGRTWWSGRSVRSPSWARPHSTSS